MTQQVQTERRSPPPPTRRILQGLGSLLLIGAIFYFLLKGIDLGQVWAIRALTWLELATLAAIAGSNLCTYALVWMSVTPGLSFGRAMVMTQATTAPANTVPAPAP